MSPNPEADGSGRAGRGEERHSASFNPRPKQSNLSANLLLRARIVLPVSRPAIENGAIAISGDRVIAFGSWKEISAEHRGEVMDLGEVILLPGLVNAHCHLDYTCMAGQLASPRSFVDWIQLITTSKSGMIYSDFAESWLSGAKMLLRTGTTTVADIEMAPELLPDIWTATPLRVISFLEMTGVKSRRPAAEILRDATVKIDSIPDGHKRMGLSPHAPYSTHPELLRLSGEIARREHLPVVTHVAESAQEFEMFTQARGAMHDWLRRSGRDMADCGRGSPVQHLERAGLLCENLLAIHVNHLAPGDAELLAKRGVSVVHCPRSHAYFRHAPFPLDELAKAGVNICLGTDSLASLCLPKKQKMELNMFDEMRQFAANHPALAPGEVLLMATINGARALQLGGLGDIGENVFADMIAIPHKGKISEAAQAVIEHRGDVAASMIAGEWAIAPANPGRRMKAFNAELERRLEDIRAQGLHRELRRVDSPQSTRIRVAGRDLLNFSSNDYLGLANHPRLNEAAAKAIEQFGCGSGASRLICGSLAPHHDLEEALACLKKTEAAISFSSGYAAAMGTICALAGKDDVIALDKLVHASIVDAARLSGAKLRVFSHNDLNELEEILRWSAIRNITNGERRSQTLIVTESIFSMDGDAAPLREIVELKERHGAWLMVDEAHATGLLGKNRRGLTEALEVSERIEVQMGTLGKALGSAGGYICGSRALVDYLVNRARSFIFSTAPVPAAAAAARAGVELVQTSEGETRSKQLWSLVEKLNFNLGGSRHQAVNSSAIIPIILGEESAAVQAAASLRDAGIYVPAIRFPTVRRNQARLRVTLTASHNEEDVQKLLDALVPLIRNPQSAIRNV